MAHLITEEYRVADIMQSAYVKRWHIRNTYRNPSIAEHQYLVTQLAHRLYLMVTREPDPMEELALLRYNLWHDMGEMLTGDLPTPIKRYLESFFKEGTDPLKSLEKEVCPQYRAALEIIEQYGERLFLISKAADVAEAAIFIRNEGRGYSGRSTYEERKGTLHRIMDRLRELFQAQLSPMEADFAKRGIERFMDEFNCDQVKELPMEDIPRV